MNESQRNTSTEAINRILRLHCLIDESKELEQKIEQQTPEESLKTVTEIVKNADDIIDESSVEERAANTNEAVLDSMLLKFNHELVAKIFQQATTFNDNMLIKAISKIVMKDNEENWDELAKVVSGSLGDTVFLNPTMMGYVDVIPKERIQRERQQRTKSSLAVEQRPETSNKLAREEKGSEAVKHVLLQIDPILRAKGTVPYYKIIIDPNSFSNTVQNSFQLSFLLSENVIAIEKGDDGLPQVRLLTSADRKSHSESAQAICTLSMDLCKRMIEHYQISESMISWTSANEEQEDNQNFNEQYDEESSD